MKKVVSIILIGLSMLFIFSCGPDFFYKMPHEPGLFVDKESFEEHKLLWQEAGIEDYSYTYSFKHYYSEQAASPLWNHVVHVTVSGGKVIDYTLVELDGKTESNTSEEEWEHYVQVFKEDYEASCFLIENVYVDIEKNMEDDFAFYKKHPESYYSKTEFEFCQTRPYILSYDTFSILMEKDLGGNSGRVVIGIEGFVEKK